MCSVNTCGVALIFTSYNLESIEKASTNVTLIQALASQFKTAVHPPQVDKRGYYSGNGEWNHIQRGFLMYF